MTLIKPEDNTYYTLDEDGQVTQVTTLNNCAKWLNAIGKIDDKLENANQNEEITFLYRGESRNMFWSKTDTEFEPSSDPYYDRFFVIGSKAKSYLLDKEEDFLDLRQFNSDTKAEYIFNSMNRLSERIRIPDYFRDRCRIDDFRIKLHAIASTENRLTIENFYLAFIHTLSSDPKDIGAHSVLISSSREYKVADDFADGGYIITFWLTNPISNQAIDYHRLEEYCELLAEYGLPKVDAIHFPDESEVTVFSATFPHNIYHVVDIAKNRIVFNPYIIKTNPNELIAHGINVDQSDFNKKMKGIYSRSIWRRNSRLLYEEESLNGT